MVQNEHSPPENIESTFHKARHLSSHRWTYAPLKTWKETSQRYTNAFSITNGEQNQEGEPVIRYHYHGYFRLEREKALAKVFLRQWLQLPACGGARLQITGLLRSCCERLWPEVERIRWMQYLPGLESGVESWGAGRGGRQEQGLDNVAQILEETQR